MELSFMRVTYSLDPPLRRFLGTTLMSDLLKEDDAVMADKGFPIGDILPPGVSLSLPPFQETPQFTRGQIFETLQIERSPVHVERAILKIEYFHV
ncbi:Biotin--protein ligase [Frankliniella fusca]|uniref:Biotin--protein ligase n=1 Tax=Frankliniella fusca TaxID=407009 RepID=A0AAE1H1G4_9NEOP|nr:Biotin--protein ligase [Frankliniella fusca]